MITLVVKRQDGSTYFTGSFVDQPTCDAWLARAQLWPAFPQPFTSSSSGTPTPEAVTAANLLAAQATRRAALVSLASQAPSTLTLLQVQTIVMHLLREELGQ